LKTEVSDLRRENSKLRKENEDLTRTNEILRDFVDATGNQAGTITDLTDLVQKLQDKVAMLEEQLAAAKRDREKEGKDGIDKPFCRLPVLDQTDRQTEL
jgi:predicted RNase H-like nuclease (RuvC/YqgF family)